MDIIQDWYKKYRNEAAVKENIITLSGGIGQDDFFSQDNINAEKFRQLTNGIEQDIVIRLNSPGGSVFDGIELYNEIKAFPHKVTVEVTALAASAATLICMAADNVKMCTGSQMMIHHASTLAFGNAKDFEQYIDDLKKIDQSLVDIYEDKTKLDRDTIIQYMDKEEMWTAEEAVELGFAMSVKASNKDLAVAVKVDVDNITGIRDQFVALNERMKELENKLSNSGEEEVKPKQTNNLKKLFGGK